MQALRENSALQPTADRQPQTADNRQQTPDCRPVAQRPCASCAGSLTNGAAKANNTGGTEATTTNTKNC